MWSIRMPKLVDSIRGVLTEQNNTEVNTQNKQHVRIAGPEQLWVDILISGIMELLKS